MAEALSNFVSDFLFALKSGGTFANHRLVFQQSECEVSRNNQAHMAPWNRGSEQGNVLDKHAPPKPRYIPRMGKSLTHTFLPI
jgi:hypothetical protein